MEELNYYLVTCDIDYTVLVSEQTYEKKKTTNSFVITSKENKITKKTLIDLHMYAAKKFIQLYQDINEVTNVELRSVSFLGQMTKEEFDAGEGKTNEDHESI